MTHDSRNRDADGFLRSALALLVGSSLPNSVAIEIDDDREHMLVHELVPESGDVLP